MWMVRKNAEEENKLHTRIYWKKGAGLLGFYRYSPSLDGGGAYVTNVRFTSKTADGWNMAETIVPNALPGAKRVWPEKLWPAEYKGLNDPELRANFGRILKEAFAWKEARDETNLVNPLLSCACVLSDCVRKRA